MRWLKNWNVESRGGMRCIPNTLEGYRARFFSAIALGGNGLYGFAQRIDSRVGMLPRIEERLRIKRADDAPHFVQFQQPRTLGDEQADAELDGRDIFYQGFITEHAQQIDITFHRGPLSKGDKRGMKNHVERAESVDDMQEILSSVAFVESAEHVVIEIFHSTDDKEAARFIELWQMRFVLFQMFDFYGDVVRHLGKLAVKFFDEIHRVTNAIEKVRITERDVLRARGHLSPNVLHHNVTADDAKDAFVNRDDGAMAAKVFAAATGFR